MIKNICSLHFETKIYLLIGSLVLYCVLYYTLIPFIGLYSIGALYLFPILLSSFVQRFWISAFIIFGAFGMNAVLYMLFFDLEFQEFWIIFANQSGWFRLLMASFISAVSYRFISLYETLLESQRKFVQLHEQLEERVKERTTELQHVNQTLQSEFRLNEELFHLKEILRNKILGHSPEHVGKEVSLLIHSINNALMIVQGRIEIFMHRNNDVKEIEYLEDVYAYIQTIDTHLMTIKQYMNAIQLDVVVIDIFEFFQKLQESAKRLDIDIQFEIQDKDLRLSAEKDSLFKGLLYLFQYIQIQTSKNITFMIFIKHDAQHSNISATNILIDIYYENCSIRFENIPELIVDILQMQNLKIEHIRQQKILKITVLRNTDNKVIS